ncbi:hypothetical protein GCM10020219_092610 [Nonomuraea dietziae]
MLYPLDSVSMPAYSSCSSRPRERARSRDDRRLPAPQPKSRNIESDTLAGSLRKASFAVVSASCQVTEPFSVMASYHMNSTGPLALAYFISERISVARAASPPAVSWLMNQPSNP